MMDSRRQHPERSQPAPPRVVFWRGGSAWVGGIGEADPVQKAHGARFEQTLTGFKWIANRAIEREREGAKFMFGYEEALGYCPGSLVRDKDGIGAALLMADMAAHLHD